MGHALCTGLAVVCGRLLAQKISPRTVNYLDGGCPEWIPSLPHGQTYFFSLWVVSEVI